MEFTYLVEVLKDDTNYEKLTKSLQNNEQLYENYNSLIINSLVVFSNEFSINPQYQKSFYRSNLCNKLNNTLKTDQDEISNGKPEALYPYYYHNNIPFGRPFYQSRQDQQFFYSYDNKELEEREKMFVTLMQRNNKDFESINSNEEKLVFSKMPFTTNAEACEDSGISFLYSKRDPAIAQLCNDKLKKEQILDKSYFENSPLSTHDIYSNCNPESQQLNKTFQMQPDSKITDLYSPKDLSNLSEIAELSFAKSVNSEESKNLNVSSNSSIPDANTSILSPESLLITEESGYKLEENDIKNMLKEFFSIECCPSLTLNCKILEKSDIQLLLDVYSEIFELEKAYDTECTEKLTCLVNSFLRDLIINSSKCNTEEDFLSFLSNQAKPQ